MHRSAARPELVRRDCLESWRFCQDELALSTRSLEFVGDAPQARLLLCRQLMNRALILQVGSAVAVAACAVACGASVPPPNDQWAAAQNDVGRAQAGGASGVPDARLHLQLAQEDLAKSRQLIGQDNNRATTLITLARAEAQLASSLAKQATTQDEERQAEDQLNKAKGQ